MKRRILKITAIFLAFNILGEIFFPLTAYALTGGPSQPEVQSFEPVGASEMVDLFTGDFMYNIPLLEVDGYPVNISYHGGISMDQEASWVGLGWNINPGVINRNMRGIPDDFDGSKNDRITTQYNIKPNRTYGIKGNIGFEILGMETGKLKLKKKGASESSSGALTFGLGIQYNNYRGFAMEQSVSAKLAVANPAKGSLDAGLGLTSSSELGLSVNPSISYTSRQQEEYSKDHLITKSVSSGVYTSFNSRTGLKAVSLDFNTHKSYSKVKKSGKDLEGHGIIIPSNGGSSISFGMNTYTPSSLFPMTSASVTFSGKAGGSFFGLDATYNLIGYYSEQRLQYNTHSIKAYGYFNAHKGASSINVLHDFNREKDGPFSLNTPALPLTNFTYDVYAVSGQGIGGMYRPFRSDIGQVYDPDVNNNSTSFSLGVELAGGNVIKGGVDPTIVDVKARSGRWKNHNKIDRHLQFRGDSKDVPGYEPFYFKQAGEKTVDGDHGPELSGENSFFINSGEFQAVRLELVKKGGLEVGIEPRFVKNDGETKEITNPIQRKARQKRNEAIYFLTIEEAKRFAIDPAPFNSTDPKKSVYSVQNAHHIGEITALRPDGARYIYGIPVYNQEQHEVTFSTGRSNSSSKGLINNITGNVSYSGSDNSVHNNKGIDNYFQKTSIPAYAHSYLLTSVLSADYVDNDSVIGPSTNDMGNYTKFNYVKEVPEFHWRLPVEANEANASEGLRSDETDDKGNYLYGKKEVWYLESIESKNHVAVFVLGDRADGLGVLNENGGLNAGADKKLKRLKNILLFTRAEYEKYKEDPATAIPLKTVHFEYDYSLCPNVINNMKVGVVDGVDNSTMGKLTLKKIYFTYQNSNKGRFSPYEFKYSTNHNFPYNARSYDRWGNYKPITGDFRNTAYVPYVEQDKTLADLYASAWNLSEIILPSGGSIKIEYESDDYAYVQDREAMNMINITGIGNHNETPGTNNILYSGMNGLRSNHFNALFVNLPSENDKDYFLENLQKIKHLYFKISVKMSDSGGDPYEFVTGYAEIDYNNSRVDLTTGKGVIALKKIGLGENKRGLVNINPVTKAALQYARLYAPKYAYNQTDMADGGIEQVLTALINSDFTKNINDMMLGLNGSLLSKGKCREVELSRSHVRLINSSLVKFGGGSRVKSVKISDQAQQFGMALSNTEYGQIYDYTTTDPATGRTISSGVASYEPMIGGEENPFREPVPFGTKFQENLLVPDDRFYLEKPFGESFFPAPVVGYSKVTVKSYIPANITAQGTGKTVHEYYTAKDFPVKVTETDLQVIPRKSPLAFRLLKISQKDYMNASQGYSIELNDMHGKPKAQWVYREGGVTPISGVEFRYKTGPSGLDNKVSVINRSGKVLEANVGVDFDMVVDTREQETETYSYGLNGNLATFLAAIIPASIPLILPAYAKEHTRFRSASVTKVINRYGILEETIAHDLGSVVSTKSIAFDGETGEVLLTETKNNYEDPVYSFTYPAHWIYDRMGQAYRNIGATFVTFFDQGEVELEQSPEVDGYVPYPLSHEFFAEGDELVVLDNDFLDISPHIQEHIKYRFWIVRKDNNKMFIMGGARDAGCKYYLNGYTKLKIIRSGRRNQQNIPVGVVTTLINPIVATDGGKVIHFKNTNYQVLSSSAAEFKDSWPVFCGCSQGGGNFYNPYYLGLKGNWRLQAGYAYLTGRTQSDPQSELRKDGYYVSYSPFWLPQETSGKWSKNADDQNWKWTTEITRYDPYAGAEIENKDPLGNYSAAVNSYNHTKPAVVSPYARYSDLYFESFEGYEQSSCNEQKLKYYTNQRLKSHSGRQSVKVPKSGGNRTLNIGGSPCVNSN